MRRGTSSLKWFWYSKIKFWTHLRLLGYRLQDFEAWGVSVQGVALDLAVYSGCEALGLVSPFFVRRALGIVCFFRLQGPWGGLRTAWGFELLLPRHCMVTKHNLMTLSNLKLTVFMCCDPPP